MSDMSSEYPMFKSGQDICGSNNLADNNLGPTPPQQLPDYSLMNNLLFNLMDLFNETPSNPEPVVDWAKIYQDVGATFGQGPIFDGPDTTPVLSPNAPVDATIIDTPTDDTLPSDDNDMQGLDMTINPQTTPTATSVLDGAPFTMVAPVAVAATPRRKLTSAEKAQRKVNAQVNAQRNKEVDGSLRTFEALKSQQVDALALKHAIPVARINKLMGTGQVLKGTCAPNAHNAMTSRAFAHFNYGMCSQIPINLYLLLI